MSPRLSDALTLCWMLRHACTHAQQLPCSQLLTQSARFRVTIWRFNLHPSSDIRPRRHKNTSPLVSASLSTLLHRYISRSYKVIINNNATLWTSIDAINNRKTELEYDRTETYIVTNFWWFHDGNIVFSVYTLAVFVPSYNIFTSLSYQLSVRPPRCDSEPIFF